MKSVTRKVCRIRENMCGELLGVLSHSPFKKTIECVYNDSVFSVQLRVTGQLQTMQPKKQR